jgi:phosphatidylglycerophosphate synthase
MLEAWPELWWDPQGVRAARRRVQKPRHHEELWAWLFLRRFSIYVSMLLARSGWVLPNHVSIAAALVVLATALWAVWPAPPSFLGLALLYNLAYLLDCVDGELARLTGRISRGGLWLDNLIQTMLLSLPLAIGFKLLGPVAGRWLGAAVLLLAFNALAALWLTTGARLALGVDISDKSVPARKRRPVLDYAILCLASDHGMFMGLPVVAAVAGDHAAAATLGWFCWHAAAAAAKNLWRILAVAAALRSGERQAGTRGGTPVG